MGAEEGVGRGEAAQGGEGADSTADIQQLLCGRDDPGLEGVLNQGPGFVPDRVKVDSVNITRGRGG